MTRSVIVWPDEVEAAIADLGAFLIASLEDQDPDDPEPVSTMASFSVAAAPDSDMIEVVGTLAWG